MSSGCGYNEYHYNVMNNISLSSDAYYLRSMLAYQHLFLHSSLGGIVIYPFFYLGLVFAATRSPSTPPPEGKLPHRRMQRPLPAEVSAADESLKNRRCLLSGVDPVSGVPPLIMTINPPSVVRPDPHRRFQPS